MPLQLQGEPRRIQRGDKERLPPLTVSQKQKLQKGSSHFQNVDSQKLVVFDCLENKMGKLWVSKSLTPSMHCPHIPQITLSSSII